MKKISDNIIKLRNELDKIEDKLEIMNLKYNDVNMKFIFFYKRRELLNEEISQLKLKMELISQFL